MNPLRLLIPAMCLLIPAAVMAQDAAAVAETTPGFLNVDIDRVVIDTDGLMAASDRLADSVDGLGQAIGQLSGDNVNLDEQQRETLMEAVASVNQASQALTRLADELPQRTQMLGEQLPRAIEATREPLAELADALESVRSSIDVITNSLPEATENSKQLVNATLDAAVARLSFYTLVLVGCLALALIAIMWFIYRQYLQPLTQKLDELVGAPEHFDNMSRHMKETSDNLLALQSPGTGRPGYPRRGPA